MSGDYLADLRVRIEPGAGAVASLREVLLVVPTVEPGQEAALDALVTASTSRPVVRAVARVVADFDRSQLPGFCLVVAGEQGGPFALVHGAVVLHARGGGDEVRLTGLQSRLWVEQALPTTVEELTVRSADGASDGGRLVLRAAVARAGGSRPTGTTDDESADVVDETAEAGRPAHEAPAATSAPATAAVAPAAAAASVTAAASAASVAPAAAGAGTDAVPRTGSIDFGADAGYEAPSEAPAETSSETSSEASAEAAPEAAPEVPAKASAIGRQDAPDDRDAEAPEVPAVAEVAEVATPASLGAGSSSQEFRPEPVRFGGGGRLETAPPPPAAVNGWHEPSAPTPAAPTPAAPTPAAPTPAAPAPGAGAPRPANPLSGPMPPLAPPVPPAPPAPVDPFARPVDPQAPDGPGRSGLPVRRPQASMPPMDRTQVVAPPGPGLFSGAVPPPAPHSFNPFEAAAPRPPQPDLVSEPPAPRVHLGRLSMENGPDVVVDCDCVIGRNPEVDPDVAHGRAKPVALPDEEQRISRVHARLVFAPGGVEIIDAGSVNGTWIEPPGGDGWIAMVPRVPAPLPLGSRIQVGDLVLSYTPMDD